MRTWCSIISSCHLCGWRGDQRDVSHLRCTMTRWWGLLAFLQSGFLGQSWTTQPATPLHLELVTRYTISLLSLLSWATNGIRDTCLGYVVFSMFIVHIVSWWSAQMPKERCRFGISGALLTKKQSFEQLLLNKRTGENLGRMMPFLTKKKSSCSLFKILIFLLKHLENIGTSNSKA